MKQMMRLSVSTLVLLACASAHGQFYKLHGASVAVGGFGRFDTPLTSSAIPVNASVPSPIGPLSNSIHDQQQFTTDSAGGLVSLLFHPKPWAGVEMNYSYTHYSERFTFISSPSAYTVTQQISVPTSAHEATGAYAFHPKHLPYQPFVNVGGGAIYFNASPNAAQWRGAGLLEAGFDLKTGSPHIAFRVEGRSLYYRAPTFNSTTLGTHSWRVTSEPVLSAVYRF
jgi:hypothetical protein